ncbi:MAG TPA: ferrochelatase [Planctomycetaceae bacterium]|nr:ferrochelatase [Planctomycetaceae bacterium]
MDEEPQRSSPSQQPVREKYDALLLVAFGGPERPEDVLPFLEHVTRSRRVPRDRLLQVAEHYRHFGGVSPLNEQVRELMVAVRRELDAHGIGLPIYWGNRNWHPFLADTVRRMKEEGIRRALAFVLSAYSSYSGCRQYLDALAAAREAGGPEAPAIDKIRVFYNHPDFIEANADRLRDAIRRLPPDARDRLQVAFTAHSLPQDMADASNYRLQVEETARLTAEAVGVPADRWELVFQSRSGRPTDPWLEPDITDHLRRLARRGVRHVVLAPIGFLSDHLEVSYDLDHEAGALCQQLGLAMVRSGTVGTHPAFVRMIRALIEERISGAEKKAIGRFGPHHDVCPPDCCPASGVARRPPAVS